MAARAHPDSVGFKHRSAFKLLTAANYKTPKGEAAGYFTAILYLAPHTLGGGATICPYSTPACREMCLSGAGLSGLPRQMNAKLARTHLFQEDQAAFLRTLRGDITTLAKIARKEGMKPALRLNGTSDVLWERLDWEWDGIPVQRYDYTKIPIHMRRVGPGYHLTYSIGGPEDVARGAQYLAAGQSVAVVVPEAVKDRWLTPGELEKAFDRRALAAVPFSGVVDGDEHDLRFLDPPGSLVLLKPKGRIETSLLRPDIMLELARAAMRAAA